MRENTCCFTGHRNIPSYLYNTICENATNAINSLISNGIDTFICGGAVGFDTICALIICKLKQTNKNLKLILFLPHRDQDKFYNSECKLYYNYLKQTANKIVYTSQDYYPGCLQLRNRCMVDNSSHIIGYCTKSFGGSFYTLNYAEENNLNIIKITDGN